MSYNFSKHSTREDATLHPLLREGNRRLLKRHDYKCLKGARSDEAQQAVFDSGNSKARPPTHPHRIREDGKCWAEDLEPWINGAPLPTDKVRFQGEQMGQFAYFLGIWREIMDTVLEEHFQATGEQYIFVQGMNWDNDAEILTDQDFDDWYHGELVRVY